MILTFTQCKKSTHTQPASKTQNEVRHAKTFDLEKKNNTLIYTRKKINENIVEKKSIPIPLKKIVLFSASSLGYLDALDGIDNVVGIYGSQWAYNPKIRQKIAQGEIEDLGNLGGANLEQIIALQPDAVMAYTDASQNKLFESLEKAGIPVILVDEYLETTPLGKAEYLRLYGHLLGKKHKADSIFITVKNNYNQLKNQVDSTQKKPTVFAEVMRGDVWYMPGGKSFVAKYINDAGGDYLWKDNNQNGTIRLTFEQVLTKAQNADFWLNASDVSFLSDLEGMYANHNLFKSFQAGKVYNFVKQKNATGMNPYFETGNVRPDWVLEDLIQILHPDILPKKEFHFYQKLE